jgi:cytochrome c553
MEVDATLAQLMKGTLFPASNVVFAAQSTNPADVPPEKDPSAALNPLASAYGKWQAVENAGLAMTEVANLLLLPGRKCSNGKPVPISNPDWAKFVEGLRQAGRATYKAAQTKNQDNILMAADTLTTACANCHDKYREKPNLADRCQ